MSYKSSYTGAQIDAAIAKANTSLQNSGDQTITGGNLVVGTAGKGVSFAANGGDILTQYDEGVFQTSITSDGGSATLSYDRLNYTRVGRMVTVSGEIVVSGVSSPTGDVYITLPFTAAASSQRSGTWSSYLGYGYSFSGTPTGPLIGLFLGDATKMAFRVGNNAGGAALSGYLTTGTTFAFGFTYQCQ